ncbi:MAG: permease component [Paenibacillaceae bacterium]|jgi:putative ABC transport system permease protein|nr:permease component [Paenibacillaceae bacterium]
MAMLRFILHKMWNTRWLTFSALLGLIVAVAFATSIPMYSDGALKRVIAKSLQEKSEGMPAGSLVMRYQAAGQDRAAPEEVAELDRYIREDVSKEIGLPYHTYTSVMSIRGTQVTPVDPTKTDPSKKRQMSLSTMTDLDKHVEITYGQTYSDSIKNGVLEAMVLEEAMFRNDLHVGDEFNYPITGGLGIAPLKVRIVGAFAANQETDPYWFQGFEVLLGNFIVHEKVFTGELINKMKIPLNLANWYYSFDLSQIQTGQIAPLEKKLTRLDINLYQKLKDTKVDVSFIDMLNDFRKESVQLQLLLFTLAAPMLGMVIYYIVMNARQSLDRQRSDIAVIRSRGGSTKQIIGLYLLESLMLGAVAIVIGPMLGWFMAKSIGSSNGFLTFVDRESIPVGFHGSTMLYGLAAVLLAMGATLIPAVQYARSSIVGLKQQLARADRAPLWQRWFLDVALLAVSGYGWYMFRERKLLSEQTGLGSDQLQVHPLLFFVPALTIFAMGLFFLRLFPWILKLLNRVGKPFFPVSIYLTLSQLSRSSKSYYPLMLLLTLTLGLGVYNSSAARTIDLNSTERTMYQFGTDVIVTTVWESVSDSLPTNQNPGTGQGSGGQGQGGGQSGGGQGQGQGGSGQGGTGSGGGQGQGGSGGNPGGGQSGMDIPANLRYVEPPFELFKELPGVAHAARVLQTRATLTGSGKSLGVVNLNGINNVDFADVGWFRKDLFPFHPNIYLNLLGTYEQAAIIPDKFAEKNQLKPGDLLNVSVNQKSMELVIVGVLPYWPSQYPDERPFVIANLDYIYDQADMMPYDVWLKMEDGAKTVPMLEKLQEQNVDIQAVKDVRNELAVQKKHPTRGGVFGILSLGFLVSVLISLIGYMLYWFFNLSSRVVQFGVLRAMGLKGRQLTGMLLLEQLFTAGLSIMLGIGIGKLASTLYLPYLQTAQDVQKQVPPFRVVFEGKDTFQLYLVTFVMMTTGAVLLLLHIRRLRVHQAVKLGEER